MAAANAPTELTRKLVLGAPVSMLLLIVLAIVAVVVLAYLYRA